jgi:peptidoglycan/xylan/chitin deacetylase (PgdA/CDA1 family)
MRRVMLSRRCRARVAALAAGLVVLAAAAPAAAAHRLIADPRDDAGPLDVRGVRLEQDGGVLALTVRLSGAAPMADLGVPGRSLCLRLVPANGAPATADVCLRARARLGLEYRALDAAGAAKSATRITGRVLQPAPDVIALRFHAADVGLPGGPFAWLVRTAWRDAGACAPGAAGRYGCVDRAPDAGMLAATLTPVPTAASCVAAGAAFRTNGSRSDPAIALTFDDGPGPDTARVLSVLERERAPATFFVVGVHVAGQEGLLQRMLADGDAIGDHSFTHADLAGDAVLARLQIDETKRAIEGATGYVPCLFRAPYGDVSPALLQEALVAGMLTVQWDVDPRDWALPPPARIVATVLREARDGSIVIMHDGGGPRGPTVEALPSVIESLRELGFRLVTVPQLFELASQAA